LKKVSVILIAVAAVAAALFIIFDIIRPEPSTCSFFAMNTYVSAEIEGKDSDSASSEITDIINNLDKNVLSRTSESSVIFKLNQTGCTDLDENTEDYFLQLADVSKQSGGAFDFTLGAISDLWKFSSTPSIPDAATLSDALSHTGYGKVVLTENKVSLSDRSAVVDFGASGKGIALDEVKKCLNSKEIDRAVVSVGGSILLYGDGKFTVGVKNPVAGSDGFAMTLKIPAGCVSTSGNYEQFFEHNGKIYHHILDPKTGYPVNNGIVSATVISQSGILSDALSTACFVLGIEDGIALAEVYGCEAVFITENKQIYVTKAIESEIEITDSSYKLMKYEN
jgi:thiamine biosynthesis lipoprotein